MRRKSFSQEFDRAGPDLDGHDYGESWLPSGIPTRERRAPIR
jgi:hypothetical protein